MKFFLIVAAVVAVAIGIGVYQVAFQKIHIPAASLSADEMSKRCADDMFRKEAALTDREDAQMKLACECMMEANAAALTRKDGVTVVEWLAEVQKKTTACMAKAGISTE
jgi:hypothetical protein